MLPTPHVTLAPMQDAEFAAFRQEAVAIFADNNVRSYRWPEAGAQARAEAQFTQLLPQGLQTPDHRLYEVYDTAQGLLVGHVWFNVQQADTLREGYLYNIHIKAIHRGRGYATSAMRVIEQMAADEGVSDVRLHVFAMNTAAQALYRSLGYWITGVNMQKRIGPA